MALKLIRRSGWEYKTDLIALDFTSDIERLSRDFTGREWLLDKVDAWLKRQGERFFILTGELGVGKSSFAAWLTHTRKDIAAYHFCIAGRNDTIVPNTVLRSLGAQLGHYLPDYGKALANTIKPEKVSVDGQSLEDLSALPKSIDEIYHGFLRRFKAQWEKRYQPILGTLAVALEPVSETQMANFTGIKRTQMRQSLGEIIQFLDEQGEGRGNPIRSITTTFWMRSAMLTSGAPPEDGHQGIADYYLKKCGKQWSTCDDYGLKYLPYHLTNAGQDLRLGNILSDCRLIGVVSDQRIIVSNDTDNTLQIWNSGKNVLASLGGHSARIKVVALSDDGNLAVSGDRQGYVKLWDLTACKEAWASPCLNKDIATLKVFSDRSRAIVGTEDGMIAIWNLERNELEKVFRGHVAPVTSIVNTPDNLHLVTGGGDGTAMFWKMDTFEFEKGGELTDRSISSLATTQDGRYILLGEGSEKSVSIDAKHLEVQISGGLANCSIEVYNLKSGDFMTALNGHTADVTSLRITYDGKKAFSVSKDNTIRIWDLEDIDQDFQVEGHQERVRAISVTPDGNRAISASNDANLKIWNLEDCLEETVTWQHKDSVSALTISAEGKRVISCSDNGEMKIWNLENGEQEYTSEYRYPGVRGIAITPDSRIALLALYDGTPRGVNIQKRGQQEFIIKDFCGSVMDVKVIQDGQRAIAASEGMFAIIRLTTTGVTVENVFHGYHWLVRRIALTLDGKLMVSASQDKSLKVWDIIECEGQMTLQEKSVLVNHTGAVTDVAISTHRNLIVSVSEDSTIRVWSINTAQELSRYYGDNPITSCALTPDGNKLIAGDSLGTVYFFKIEEPKIIG